jgi:hypothetical protein
MTRFSVGDEVIIRFGKHQGQKASIIERQPANVYRVKVEDGYILFYSEQGLEKEKEGVQEGV